MQESTSSDFYGHPQQPTVKPGTNQEKEVKAEPGEVAEDHLIGLVGGALDVGIRDTEDKLSAPPIRVSAPQLLLLNHRTSTDGGAVVGRLALDRWRSKI